jgi:FtsZ-binding cell division protein ZapB
MSTIEITKENADEVVDELMNDPDFLKTFQKNINKHMKEYIGQMQTYKRNSANFEYQPYVDYARKKQEDRVLMKQALAIINAYSVEDYFSIIEKCVENVIRDNHELQEEGTMSPMHQDSTDESKVYQRIFKCNGKFYQKYFDVYSKNFISQLNIAMKDKIEPKPPKSVVGGDDKAKLEELEKENEKLKEEIKKLIEKIEGGINTLLKDPLFVSKLMAQKGIKYAIKTAIKSAVTPSTTPTPSAPIIQGTVIDQQTATNDGAVVQGVLPPKNFDTQIVKAAVDNAIASNATILETVSDSVFQSICRNDELLNNLKTTTTEKFDSNIDNILNLLLSQTSDKKGDQQKGGQRTRKRKNKSIKNIYIK